jgi:hypothetical protein
MLRRAGEERAIVNAADGERVAGTGATGSMAGSIRHCAIRVFVDPCLVRGKRAKKFVVPAHDAVICLPARKDYFADQAVIVSWTQLGGFPAIAGDEQLQDVSLRKVRAQYMFFGAPVPIKIAVNEWCAAMMKMQDG